MLLDATAPVSSIGVPHDLTGIVDRFQVSGNDLVERGAFRAGDLDDTVSWCRERHIREEEKAHEEWLEEQLRQLGGETGPEGERLLEVRREARRREDVLLGDPEPAQLFRQLLAAEVSDVGGWELLLEIAGRAQDDEARDAFQQRLHEEQEHFRFLCHIAAVFAGSEILDETVTTLEDASA